MKQFAAAVASAFVLSAVIGMAQQPSTDGPYKILKKARVGGEGGWDYIYADVAGRRLYIPRRGLAAVAATDTTPAVPASQTRLTIYDLDTLDLVTEVEGVGGNGTAVGPKSAHG